MKKIRINNLFVCATEQSGDNIGEKIIEQLKIKKNNCLIDGVGGDRMAPLLKKQFFSLKDFKSIGIIEIIGSINKYLSMIEKLSEIILKNDYNIIITIDSPDFNFRLAKKIRKKGFKGKIIHVVAPTVWAWREGRSKKFAAVFDKMLTIFPFENTYFIKYGLRTTFIGNPIYYINSYINKKNNKYIAFMPGSREGEIESLIKYFKIAADYLEKTSSNLTIFIPTTIHLKNKLVFLTKNWYKKPILHTNISKIEKLFTETSFALVCSGTASLEISKRKIPQLVIYKLNIMTEIILKLLISVKFANVINIMANKMIIPEIVNSNLKTKNFLEGFKNLIHNNNSINDNQIIQSKKYLDKLLLKESPAKIAAKEIDELFFKPKPLKN